jgi:GT2 family glycosyltransferase
MNRKYIDCSVIILNYNGSNTIENLLESVAGQTILPKETVVLDNCSKDGSDETAQRWCRGREGAAFHKFESNVGFARAMNWGIAHTSGKYVCLLNVDVILEKSYLEKCCEALNANDNVGMACGVLYRLVDGKKTLIIDSLGIGLNKNRYHDDINAGVKVDKPVVETTHPFGVGGCAPVYLRKMLDDVAWDESPFLEIFESYSEDVDLAWRARKHGWTAVCTAETTAWHVREGSLANKKLRAIARNRNHRNRIWLMVLNERPSILLRHLPYWLPLQVFFILKVFLQPGLFFAYAEAAIRLPQIVKIRALRNKRRSSITLGEELGFFAKSSGAYRRRILKHCRKFWPRLSHS